MEDMFERPEHLSQVLQSVGLPAFDSTIVGNCGGKTKKAYKVSNQNTLKSIYPELVEANNLGDIHCKKGSPSHQSKHKQLPYPVAVLRKVCQVQPNHCKAYGLLEDNLAPLDYIFPDKDVNHRCWPELWKQPSEFPSNLSN
jgi:hypothetical protein